MSSYQKMWISSGSDNEEEETINIDDLDSTYSDMLKNVSYSLWSYWEKRKSSINTDFVVTGWVLCVILHIKKYAKDHTNNYHRKLLNDAIKHCFVFYLKMNSILLHNCFRLGIMISITIMGPLMVMNLSGKVNTPKMVMVIFGIRSCNIFWFIWKLICSHPIL